MKLLSVLAALVAGTLVASEVTVYTYDSFASKGSLGPVVQAALEKEGIRTRFVRFSSAGEAVNQILLEGGRTKADLVVGLDESLAPRLDEKKLLEKLPQALLDRAAADLKVDAARSTVVPFDYGFLALVYDSSRMEAPRAQSLRELATQAAYAKRIAIQDPRTSSIGLSFLLWTRALYGDEGTESFWKGFASKVLTVSPGWSAAYGLFLKKEADLVVSYTTSPAYHIEHEKSSSIKAVIFPEGHLRQIEGAALLKRASESKAARRWLEVLLSDDIQAKVPLTQWMYPAVKSAPLPESFKKLPTLPKAIEAPALTDDARKALLRRWAQWMSAKP